MSQINPFTGSILQAPQVQRTQAAARDQQLRKAQDLAKNAALQGEQLEHEVESSEPVIPANDGEARKQSPRGRKRRQSDESLHVHNSTDEHIDLTA